MSPVNSEKITICWVNNGLVCFPFSHSLFNIYLISKSVFVPSDCETKTFVVSVVGKQWKLLEGFAQRPNLFIQLPMVTHWRSRLNPGPFGSSGTPTPYLQPTSASECRRRNSMVWWTGFHFPLLRPISFPNPLSLVLDLLLFSWLSIPTHAILSSFVLIIALY